MLLEELPPPVRPAMGQLMVHNPHVESYKPHVLPGYMPMYLAGR